jgi:hypothetical protein
MKILIAISSCWDFEQNGNNQAMRDTWLPDARGVADVRFFFGIGQGAETAALDPAEMVLLPEVQDHYGELTYKTRASAAWALEHGYDFLFRCFPDTYVRVDRLMKCGFEGFDYFGDFRGDPSTNEVTHQKAQNYASGGPGYMLSQRAFSLLPPAPVIGVWRDDITPYAEDLWVGNILGRSARPLAYFDDNARFINRGSHYWPTRQNDVISTHLSCPERYDKATMYAAHRPWSLP